MFGLLNINKPPGITSRRVVDVVQRLVRPDKAGHAGTLDPLATGVLVVCVGQATRLIEYVQRMPKRYRATFLLGRSSPTEDIEGEVTELPGAPEPSRSDIERVAHGMLGQIQQRPPEFSAIKVDGRRSYALARAGQPVKLEPRTITIFEIDLIEYVYPRLVLDVRCGSGTYVRTLGRELAERLGSCAVMSALDRTAIGSFRVEEAVNLADLTPENLAGHWLSPLAAVAGLPRVDVNGEEAARLANGVAIERPTPFTAKTDTEETAAEFAAVDASGRLVAILQPRGPDRLAPLRYFPQSPQ